MPGSSVYAFDPLTDPRWPEFVAHHPGGSVFHTRGWLRALESTYQYEPMCFTTCAPGLELRNGVVFCAVRSWMTGRRLVSLPFSDHCEPLIEKAEELEAILAHVEQLREREGWKYAELRPVEFAMPAQGPFHSADTFCLHRLDLRRTLDQLLQGFHKDSVQRKIRRAEREGLEYQTGRSKLLLKQLCELLALTRRRHGVPPQPAEWFRNLVDCMGDALTIRIASKDGRPVAGILTLHSGKKVVYKYGGSDATKNRLGGMALLFWKTIQEAKQAGAEEFDLGRSDHDNPGLVTFKDHWAARRSTLTYWRSPAAVHDTAANTWKARFARQVFSYLPGPIVARVGKLLYRHIG